MRRRPLRSALLASWLALACSTPAGAPTSGPAPRPDLAASLIDLGASALAAGDLAAAEDRFARALEADPAATAAHVGLGNVALARGDLAAAGDHFARAREQEPGSVDVLLGLARVARRSGRGEEARPLLDLALEADPWRAELHAELAALSGRAPRTPADPAEAVRRAREHPYDPAAGLVAATALAAAGRGADATRLLESQLWLADLDPEAARGALDLLVRLDPSWREWRVVPVYSFADESIRAQPGWRFRVRLAWLGASQSLGSLLHVWFLPMGLAGFSSSGTSAALEAIDAAFRAQTPQPPAEGVLAAFTARPPPKTREAQRLGEADFLGRRLALRLEAAPGPSRVLLHELLHLYGGVHVNPEVESLMNPAGNATQLDALNARIARELRGRGFRGDVESDVLDRIDLEGTTRAYEAALRANLALRRAGFAEAMQVAASNPVEARRQARRVRELDPHLGDVARFVSLLLLRGDNPASAAFLLETAARLYGPRSARGRESADDAARIWQQILPGNAR